MGVRFPLGVPKQARPASWEDSRPKGAKQPQEQSDEDQNISIVNNWAYLNQGIGALNKILVDKALDV